MKFGQQDLSDAITCCKSVTETIDLTPKNIALYKAAIQYGEHILLNLDERIDNKQPMSELKNAIRQLKADLYLYTQAEPKKIPRNYVANYIKENKREIIQNDKKTYHPSALGKLTMFPAIDHNPINKKLKKNDVERAHNRPCILN